IEMEVMTLLPPVTANSLQETKVPPAVRPIESSAVPSSIMYVNRGILASNDLTIPFLPLAFGTFGAGARKALAGARAGIRAEFGLDTVRDIFPAAVFRAA